MPYRSSAPPSITSLIANAAPNFMSRMLLSEVLAYCLAQGITAPAGAYMMSQAFSDTSTATIGTDGGKVGSVIDITGNGYNLIQATTGNQPILRKQGMPNGTAGVDFTNNGTASLMATTTVGGNGIFAATGFSSGLTIYKVASSYYGASVQSNVPSILGAIPSPSNSYMGVYYSSSNDFYSKANNTAASEINQNGTSTVMYDPSGVHVYAWDGTTLTCGLNGRYQSVAASGTVPTSGNYTVGNLAAGGFPFVGLLSGVWVFPGKHTQAQMDAIGALLAADSGLVRPAWLAVGDSITHGYNLTTPYQMNWQTQASQLLGLNSSNTYISNMGIDGEQCATMVTDFASYPNLRAGQVSAVRGNRNLITIFAGTNDMGNQGGGGNVSAATAFASLQSLVALYRAANPYNKIAVATCLPRSASNAGASFEARRLAYNVLIRAAAGTGLYDILLDFGNDAIMGQASNLTNTTYYQGDQIHPTQIGHSILARIAATALSVYYSGVAPVLASTVPGVVAANSTGADATYTTSVSSTNYPGSKQSSVCPIILPATTAGRADLAMPDQTSSNKVFLANFYGYENNSAVNQTYAFPTAFQTAPSILSNTTGLSVSASTTTFTITAPNNTTTFSGNINIEGF